MSTDNQTLIYVGSFVGMLGFLGVFGEILRRKHHKEVQERNILLDTVRQRQQQVIDENLPPFYADHVRDPLVTNDEVPLETIIGTPLEHPAEVPIVMEASPSSPTPTRAATATTAGSNAIYQETVIIMPESTSAEFVILPPPPSYDAPNLVVERSPAIESDTRMTSEGYSSPSPSLHSSSSIVFSLPTSSSLPQPSTPSTSRSPDEQTTPEQPLDAPRYSAEFPPHIPHARHLDNYRRSRALSDATSRPPLPLNLLTAASAEAVAI